ncbi:hypothetical protein ACJX0J_006294, partial [Zea mays]
MAQAHAQAQAQDHAQAHAQAQAQAQEGLELWATALDDYTLLHFLRHTAYARASKIFIALTLARYPISVKISLLDAQQVVCIDIVLKLQEVEVGCLENNGQEIMN